MTDVKTISITIDRDWREVYAFASEPDNFPRWASGLGHELQQIDGIWFVDGPDGRVEVRFTAPNDFGILDHHVVMGNGAEIYIPLRVIAHGSGSELIFTLFRQPGMDDAQFAADAEWVERDLKKLKEILEAEPSDQG